MWQIKRKPGYLAYFTVKWSKHDLIWSFGLIMNVLIFYTFAWHLNSLRIVWIVPEIYKDVLFCHFYGLNDDFLHAATHPSRQLSNNSCKMTFLRTFALIDPPYFVYS